MKPFQYVRPAKLSEAIAAFHSDPEARYIAGGTNLTELMKRGVVSVGKLIDINHLPLRKIEQKSGFTRIGALALNSDVAAHKLIIAKHPLLAQALNAGASGQLRNMATVGGNILQQTRCTYYYDAAFPCNRRQPESGCSAVGGINRMHAIFGNPEGAMEKSCIAVHPGDMGVALAALDARVIVLGQDGERSIPFHEFYKNPDANPAVNTTLNNGELVVAVEIPDQGFAQNIHYLKVRDRASYAFALVSVAAALDMEQGTIKVARLAMGGVAYKPWRLPEAEKLLTGRKASEAIFAEAAAISLHGARPLAHNAYKLKLASNIIVEALKTAARLT